MKKILGLDLGTTSIGWAFVHEAENENEQSKIIKLGVRVNPLTTDEQSDFEKGKSITINADRTLKRGARRNLQRVKQRRENLIEILKSNHFISDETILSEQGNKTTFETWSLRAKAAKEKIEKCEFARVLLAINKKRGYKSSRKAKNEEEGQIIDGMAVALKLYDEKLTPGQYCYSILKDGKKSLPDFYRSDLQAEFDIVWNFQKQFYADILTEDFYKKLQGQGMQNTRKMFLAIHKIYTAENKGTRDEKKLQAYLWRSKAISEQLPIEEVAFVITEINNNLNQSSGYLGAISDRSKELYFNKQTVGQYLQAQIQKNPHTRLKGQVFYRQDFLDEFEKIWETQKQFHSDLTDDLKEEIRDVVIFYQRKLKSQKSLISFCEFESSQKEIVVDRKTKLITIGNRVCPKSSPLFQEFKIWQILSNLIIRNKTTTEEFQFDIETKQLLFNELNIKGNLKKEEILKMLVNNPNEWEMNYTTIEGNRTNAVLYEAFIKMFEMEGHEFDFSKSSAIQIQETISSFFTAFRISTEILHFNALLDGNSFDKQPAYVFWHLLYSYEGDDSATGNDTLYRLLETKFGFKREFAQILANVSFQDDYGSLSSKAIRKIMPFIQENKYNDACALAGYNHSSSVTKEENLNRILKSKLDLLPKNSLRNPVVEKILNQMVNIVNAIIHDSSLGKPDEIRIELARELKKNAKERAELMQSINDAKNNHDKIYKELQTNFGIKNPTRNDIIRYKLYQELASNGYKTLYTNTYIPKEKLFSKEFDIEHIIPKARLFDDSFSNKTLEARQANIDKRDETAYDYVSNTLGAEALQHFITRVESLHKEGKINKAKYKKLLMKGSEIGEGFIERDLRESQYIAKKAKEMLLEICRSVVSTSGSITDKLREDWGLINIMQELNIEKYRAQGLTEQIEGKDGNVKEKIIDWTKRNDHRHHAMDALTIAFTKHNHIQYLNNLNARKNETNKKHGNIIAIEQKETYKDENDKRLFKLPLPNFRSEAKMHLEKVLISFKAKNKIVTRNKNKIRGSSKVQITLTPRGQMHKETVYGKIQQYATKEIKIGPSCDISIINQIANKKYREALLNRLQQFENDPKKAFGGKNALAKNPILLAPDKPIPEKVNIVIMEDNYTIRKEISPDLVIDKVIDVQIKRILQQRLQEYNNDTKAAFSNLDKNPIWLNKEKGISIKRVTISGVSNAEALHFKKDHNGKAIVDSEGKQIPTDFVSTGNNHHVAIYRDESGNLQEEVISFYEAVARVNAGMPIIKKQHEKGWQFLFTMKQNEMFVFPSANFDPTEIDLLNPDNYHLISPNLFRVQKIGSLLSGFWFRHHLETNVENKKELKGITFKVIQSANNLEKLIKIRINHLGQIVQVGEY